MLDKIERSLNKISFQGSLDNRDLVTFASKLHQTIDKKRYRDIILDFSNSSHVAPSFMVPALALIRERKFGGVDFELNKPNDRSVASIFHNADWDFWINDEKFERSKGKVNITFHVQTSKLMKNNIIYLKI